MIQCNLHLPECHDDADLGKQISFNNLLRQVRHKKYFPSLYFPSAFAGPDVVLMMKSNNSEDYILCAIQASRADHGRECFC